MRGDNYNYAGDRKALALLFGIPLCLFFPWLLIPIAVCYLLWLPFKLLGAIGRGLGDMRKPRPLTPYEADLALERRLLEDREAQAEREAEQARRLEDWIRGLDERIERQIRAGRN